MRNSHTFTEQFHVDGGSDRRFANLWFHGGPAAITLQASVLNTGEDTVYFQIQKASRVQVLDIGAFANHGSVVSVVGGGQTNITVTAKGYDLISFVSSSMLSTESANIVIDGITSSEASWINENEYNYHREVVYGSSVYEIDITTPTPIKTYEVYTPHYIELSSTTTSVVIDHPNSVSITPASASSLFSISIDGSPLLNSSGSTKQFSVSTVLEANTGSTLPSVTVTRISGGVVAISY